MNTSTLTSHFFSPNHSNLTSHAINPSLFISIKATLQQPKSSKIKTLTKNTQTTKPNSLKLNPISKPQKNQEYCIISSNGYSRYVIVGAVSIGFVMLIMGIDEHKALALGPEGPLMEEFWDNVRRYGLYALSVSTGALYTIFQPIFELLKNPISAILILTILGGGFFIVTQIVSAMIGVTEFSYEYAY